MDGINMENLNINEEEALNFDLEENSDEQHDVNLCLVGRFIHDRPIKFNSMKTRMADVWRPMKSMVVKEATQGLYLFKNFHPLDVEEVMKGGLWLFDNYTLVIDRMKVGVALHDIPLYHVNFWVQIHNVPVGMMLEKVGKRLANYIGEFVEYDKNNSTSFWRQYMRVKVRVDVRRPLKIEKKIMLNGGLGGVVKFKYERLGLFCFVCGVIGHSENKCEVKYTMERDDDSRGWSNEIRADVRRPRGRVDSRWLREERSSMGGVHTDCHASQREPQSSRSPQSNETQPRPRDNGRDSYQGGNEAVVTGRNINQSMLATMGSPHPNHELTLVPSVATNSLSCRPILTLSNDRNTRQVGNEMIERGTAQISPIANKVSQTPGGSHLDDKDMEVQVERKRRRAEGLPGLMIILSWNYRGLGGPSAIPNLRKLARLHKPDILFLSETLAYARHLETIRVMLGFDSCLAVDVEGRSGGLAVLWKESSNCSILNYTRNFINLLVDDEQRGEWRLTCYYGYPERNRRSCAWDMMRELGNMSSLHWCIIGDFNDLLSQKDKRGNLPHPNWLCMGFRQVISDCDLSDIQLEGYPFTWIKSRGTPHVIEERLDRAMASTSWLNLFPNLVERTKFREVVLDGWGVHENIEVVDRVARCANRLQRWGRKKKVKYKEEMDECVRMMEVLRGIQGEEEGRRYQEIHDRHGVLIVQEEDYWKQRAKMHWLKESDMNTSFFHKSASARRKKKNASKLVNEDGLEVHTQEELCEVAKQYFDTLFKPKNGEQESVLNLIQRRVTEEDNVYLAAPITKDEIQQALFMMHPDKSPRPDGFNPAFYQRFWEQCGDDIFVAASNWLDKGYFPTSLNETNICLIHKCDNPISMKDLSPISLCNVLYKMISKVLANRLKICLDRCVSQEQSTFVEGRSILDNALIATEVIHALKRKTKGRSGELALKIDISKAYDKVDWGFLRGVLTSMGFGDIWIRWIMMCVSSVNYSVLMNYDKVGPIIPGRGLRQGDPLSLYLFILVAEGLTSLIHQAVGRGDVHGARICRGAPEVSHLLFADDCFLFCRASIVEVNHLISILHTYELASGQEINLTKSEVFFSRNLSHAAKEGLARILGVRHVSGIGIYLGLPSMIGRSKKAIFSYIKDRIWKKMNSWRGRALSKAGKEVMIKYVLQAILSYVMSMFILPSSLIDDFEKMLNAFWWGGGKSLAARIIKARYFPRSSLLEASLGYNPSFAWRSICKARQILLSTMWRVTGMIFGKLNLLTKRVTYSREDDIHVFFGCVVARECWMATGFSQLLENPTYQDGTVAERVFEMCRNEDNAIIGRVSSLFWCIWHNRNDKIWNDNTQLPSQVGRMAFAVWNEWFTVHQLRRQNIVPVEDPRPVRWEKPGVTWIKCNMLRLLLGPILLLWVFVFATPMGNLWLAWLNGSNLFIP
ncbi:hypothetical protein TSUD_405720 [Trifolium subterraneum]|uniref:Reverse transcriptase domain-containing protein n=1 Tax=Trifolium subterraneum TaxID=3900 RepID=A0A2Z6NYM1_TRISU|nr:hypothetical protein TSUD_405720 [Trifolium subterraneum]